MPPTQPWIDLTNRRTKLIDTENALVLTLALLELRLKVVQQELEEVRFLLENQHELEDYVAESRSAAGSEASESGPD